MRSSTRGWLTIAAAFVVISGCSVSVASGSPSPSLAPAATFRPSVTPNPNQIARQSARPSPSATPSPSASPVGRASATPIPTPAPLTEMQAKLPILVGGGGFDPRPIEATRLFGGFVDQVAAAQRLLDAVGATAADFEGAGATCCSEGLSVFDMRIRGVPATRLADALVDVSRQVESGSVLSTRTADGIRVTRLRWSTTTAHDLHVAVIDDVVFAFTGVPARQKDVDGTIAFMRRPRLEDLLPATIGGQPTQRAGLPASALPTGGDMCVMVCPLEPTLLAKAIKVPIEQIDLAYATAGQPPGTLVIAFRVPGASNAALVEARIASYGGGGAPYGRDVRKVGGKSVTWVAMDPFPNSGQHEYLYARDHVLYSIRPTNDEGPPNGAVVEAITALP